MLFKNIANKKSKETTQPQIRAKQHILFLSSSALQMTLWMNPGGKSSDPLQNYPSLLRQQEQNNKYHS